MATTLLFLLFFSAAVMAAEPQKIWSGTIHQKIHGPKPNQVWPLLQDFCNIYKVFPVDVSFCVGGVPGQVGQRRYMAFKALKPDNTTFISWEKHYLVELDPIKRSLTYHMMENNVLVTMYRSTMTVEKHKVGSQLKWKYMANPVQGYSSEVFRARLQWILQNASNNMEKLLGSA